MSDAPSTIGTFTIGLNAIEGLTAQLVEAKMRIAELEEESGRQRAIAEKWRLDAGELRAENKALRRRPPARKHTVACNRGDCPCIEAWRAEARMGPA